MMKESIKLVKKVELEDMSKEDLLSLVIERTKGRTLFPRLVQDARKFIQDLKKSRS